jgi:hypothetical protein
MTENQKDILNRVKLFMSYDSKNTLSENYNSIIEQTAYERSLEQEDQPKEEEWKPNVKTIPGILGGIEVPKETRFITYNVSGPWKTPKRNDDLGQYMTKLDAKTQFPRLYKSFEKIKKCIGKSKEVILDDNSKCYWPTKDWESSLQGKVQNFTIPKGTLIPFLDEEGIDEWSQKPLEEDRTFKMVMKLEDEDFCKSILIDESDGSRGWTIYPDYYWTKPDGVKESYVKTNYIEFRSPEKVFWDDYGMWIEIAGSIALTIASGGLAAPLAAEFGVSRMTAGFVADFVLNGIFNAGIAMAQYNWGDDQMAALALFFAFLPIIHRYSPISKWIVKSNIQNLDSVSKSLMGKILKVRPNSAQEWKQFTSKLSKDEINLLSDVSKMKPAEIQDMTKVVIKEATEKMINNDVKPSINFFKRLIPGWKGVIRGSKGLLSFGIDMVMIEAFSKSWENLFGTMPRPGDYEALLLFVKNLPAETKDDFMELVESGDLDGTINLEGEMVSAKGVYENLKSIGDTMVLAERPKPIESQQPKTEEQPVTEEKCQGQQVDADEASELVLIRREDGEFKYNVEPCKGEWYVTLNR